MGELNASEAARLELSMREYSRNHMLGFVKYTKPDYVVNWHHEVMCELLDKFSIDPDFNKLMIFAPPQTGKSELTSRRFPSYFLGKNPEKQVVVAGYSETFAKKFSKDVRRIIKSQSYKLLFPNVSLGNVQDKEVSATKLELDYSNGTFSSVGVATGLTGYTADLLVIDDPIKDSMEANSRVYRDRLWDWYFSVASTRLDNRGKILVTLTRWHEDDLAGRLLKQEKGEWKVVVFPAINENGMTEYDSRRAGEALWEGKHSLSRYLKIKLKMPSLFASLYQQSPKKAGGNIVKEKDLKVVDYYDLPNGFFNEKVDFVLDTAFTEDSANDPSAIMAYVKFNNCMYIMDYDQQFKEFGDLVEWVRRTVMMLGDSRSMLSIEPKANGLSVLQHLKKTTFLNVKEHKMLSGDKLNRAHSITPLTESGRVYLIRGAWNDAFIEYISLYPRVDYKEAMDLLAMALTETFNLSHGVKVRRMRKSMVF